ncbi:class I SAM-dependent methyltransferase [Heyndrickxia sp. NPDC080065]|uniref:class I SAM-dependent methyltransferase n=1 Tax=Heyndrickxia sp. NPDC080065 TaxID=3390568 RepID=UPI003CFF5BC4
MVDRNYFQLIKEFSLLLENENIPYHFIDSTSLWLQGVELAHENTVFVEIQWDALDNLYELLEPLERTELEKNETQASFQAQKDNYSVYVKCHFNTTIKTEPYRIEIIMENHPFWCVSLYKYLYYNHTFHETMSIQAHLEKEQRMVAMQNEGAWNQNNYAALLNRYGSPQEIAEKIKQNPKWRLHPFYKYLTPLKDKKVLHLMGSNGIKAVAMSLLGANVTVVDFSKENEMFAKEIASLSDIDFTYIVSDVLSLSTEKYRGHFDIVLMELGVLHYFIDLHTLMEKIHQLLCPNGRFVLHEFHPISTKLITSTGKKHKVTGNYFDSSIEKNHVAFTKHMPEEEKKELQHVLQRKWTLGEVITSVGQSELLIEVLEEEPNHKISDIGLPKTFTLVAKKL